MAVYSHSRLSVFELCPRQFFYRYRAKVKVDEEEGIEGFLGTQVHDALEKLYRDRMFGRVLSADELIGYFNERWSQKYHNGIAIVRAEYGPDDYRRVGEDCLRKYHSRYQPFDQSSTLALEEKVVVNLDGTGNHRLQGYIDRLSQAPDGVVEVHDYKTNLRLPTQEDKDQDRQLALYQLGVMERWPDTPKVVLIWHFLRHDKEIRSSRTPDDLKQLRKQTIALIDEIEARESEDDFPTRESALCDWCAYQDLCPCCKHAVAVEGLPTNRFLKEPGVKLVNRLSGLKAKKAALNEQIALLDAEQGEVMEALVEYARREGMELVVGSTHAARIVTQRQIILPRKGQEPKEYAELENKLRGSKSWSAVSIMDVARLRRIWVGDEEDPGRVRKTMKPLVREQEIRKVGLRKRKGDAADE